MTRRPPTSTLFPYTTLFRSRRPFSIGRLTWRGWKSSTAKPVPGMLPPFCSCTAFRHLLICSAISFPCLRINIMSRSEEYTSELQSRRDLVCRLLLEKKNTPLTRRFVFNDTPTTDIYTLSLHDALPISPAVFYRTLNVEGLEIFYREAGPWDAPAVLLLHGFPSSSHMFRNLIPMLADKYHVEIGRVHV